MSNGDDVAIARQQRRLVRVTRPSVWSNPYATKADARFVRPENIVATREEALAKYREHLARHPEIVERAKRELRGKILGCWCLPQPCHAQILAEIVNKAHPGDAARPVPRLPPSPEELLQKARENSPTTLIAPVPDAVVAAAQMGAYDPRAFGARCDECPLKGRHTPVPPTWASGGPGQTKLIVIGEGPGRMEIQEGRPFVGPSGSMLTKLLIDAGVSRGQCHLTNAGACRGDTDWEKDRAAACCSARLSNELSRLDPKIPILALGAPAARVMLGKGSILKTRGLVWTLPEIDASKVKAGERALVKRKTLDPKKFAAAIDRCEQSLWRLQARAQLAGRTCIPTIHPAYVLRGGEQLLPMLRVDIKRAGRAARGELVLLDDGPYAVARTVTDLQVQLKTIRTKQVIIDVETLGPEPLVDKMTMLGISEVPDGEIVKDDDVRVVLASPPRETPQQRRKAQKVLREMGAVINKFLAAGHVAGGHNFASFDMLVLDRYDIHPAEDKIFDSLIAHHTYASHLRQGLDHLASMYVDIGPWKAEFKAKGAEEKGGVQSRWMSSEDLDLYNSIDVRANAVAWRRQQADLRSELDVYAGDMRSAAICRGMAAAGFSFDMKLAEELSQKLRFRAGALLGQMRMLVGRSDFHPARPGDLRAALFGQYNIKPIEITKTGLASTSSRTLEAVKGDTTRAGKLADLILRWRATQKTKRTFIDSIRPGKDGRVHPSWKAFGTVTGRFSCSRPNLMNLPRWSRALEDRVRELYMAAPGHVLIYFDLSQSEMRMAAYLSGDENFIASCESGDVHTSNAKILFPDARDVLESDPKGKYCPRHGEQGDAKSECKCGKPFRDVAKNAGFGILYQADSETIFKFLRSKGFDVTLPDVEAMFAQIHKIYARYYEFCQENMAYCKRHGHLREFFSNRIRWLGWYPAITDVSNYCLDDKTEALTRRGWVPGFDLKPGDMLLSKNADTDQFEWKPITRMNLIHNYVGELIEFRSRSFNAVTTPDHRWLTRHRRTGKNKCLRTHELAAGNLDYSIHRTGTYSGASCKTYTDDFVELVGWVLTDGHIGSNVITVTQSRRGNRKKVARIDALMARIGPRVGRSHDPTTGKVDWHMYNGTETAHVVRSLFPQRLLTMDFMLALTADQLQLLMHTMLDGDGCRSSPSSPTFFCRSKEAADAFVTLCTLCGKAANMRWKKGQLAVKSPQMKNRPRGTGGWLVTILSRDTAQVIAHPQRYGRNHKAINQVRRWQATTRVWCPVVANTYFVARREGCVFVTGNCVQGGIAALMNDRLQRIHPHLPKRAKFVAQIHDACITEAPGRIIQQPKMKDGKPVLKDGKPVMQGVLEGAVALKTVSLIQSVWGETITTPTNGKQWVMPIDLKYGVRWSDFG